jgi:hypothetical protein
MTTVIKTAGNNKSDLIVHVEFYHNKYFYLLLNCKRHLFELSLDVEKSF